MTRSSASSVGRINVHVFRVPLARPVQTSFGAMHDWSGVFVRLEDEDSVFGWGEVFANWPTAGAEHRARLLVLDIADLVIGQRFESRAALFRRLARFLNPEAADSVPVSASGIHVQGAAEVIDRARGDGHDAFKIKLGSTWALTYRRHGSSFRACARVSGSSRMPVRAGSKSRSPPMGRRQTGWRWPVPPRSRWQAARTPPARRRSTARQPRVSAGSCSRMWPSGAG